MAGAALDMSLDDLIKNNKKSGDGGGRGRGRGRASGPGPAPSRRFNNRSVNRSTPYGGPKAPDAAAWNHELFGVVDHSIRSGGSAIETETRLYISNLDYGVSNEDIKELFSEVGDLKKYSINYDRSGRSKGTAEVVFARRQDALAAVKRYNNVQLDGKPMKVEIVGINLVAPVGGLPVANTSVGNMNGYPRSGQVRNAGFGRPRGGAGRGVVRGGRGGRGRGGRGEKISADDLDADLEKYHLESMQTN